MKPCLDSQKGNALWFILLVVALLGILTAVVSRTGNINQTGSVEQSRIRAASILRYAKSVENAVQKMVTDGISENDLDFVAISAPHNNPNCITNECEVFHTEGGGLEYRTAANILGDNNFTGNWQISGDNRLHQMGCDDNDAGCTELLLLLEGIPQMLCLQINAIQNITNPADDAPRQKELEVGTAFTGTFGGSINSDFIGGTNATDEAPQVAGKSTGCVYKFGGGANKYYFYQVLIVR